MIERPVVYETLSDGDLLFNDNILVGEYGKGMHRGLWYFRIFVTTTGASVSRYCVPGRIDNYDFSWMPSSCQGYGDRVAMFTDTNISLARGVWLVKKDLKKKQVKELIRKAKEALKATRSIRYLDYLLEALR